MTTTVAKRLACEFGWDDLAPPQASSDRGWGYLQDHSESGGKPCGWYLDYGPPEPGLRRGPNGETVLWQAYIYDDSRIGGASNAIHLGCGWQATVAEAKEMIEGNIRAYFGLPRAA